MYKMHGTSIKMATDFSKDLSVSSFGSSNLSLHK